MEDVNKIVEKVNFCISDYAAEALDILKKFSSIDCGTKDIEGNKKVVEIVEELLSRIQGIQIERYFIEGFGYDLAAKLNEGNPNGKIVLNAHMDTVFKKGDAQKHPFRIQGDQAYGLGIADCKGGIVVSILSVLALQKAGALPDKEIVFLFGCDEELGSPVSYDFYRTHAIGADMAFAFEPAREENGILTSRKGSLNYHIECRGKQAHAGNAYDEGASAVVELADKIMFLYENNDNERKIQFNIAMITDGMNRVNIVPDFAAADVGVRILNQADLEYVEKVINKAKQRNYVKGCSTMITCTKKLPPMPATLGNKQLYKKIAEIGQQLGMELPEQSSGGYGDACFFSSLGIPTVDGLGPYMYKIHSTEENMKISSLKEKIQLFCAVLGTI